MQPSGDGLTKRLRLYVAALCRRQAGFLIGLYRKRLMTMQTIDALQAQVESQQRAIDELRIAIVRNADLQPDDAQKVVLRRQRKSVVFFHRSYYHFLHLSAELRRRGWDAVSVNIDDPQGFDGMFNHGCDVDLFDSDPVKFKQNLDDYRKVVIDRFNMVYFYGLGRISMYPLFWFNSPFSDNLPNDVLEFRRHGIFVGLSTTGCFDLISKTKYRSWSENACNACSYDKRPETCSDLANLSRAHRSYSVCDVIEIEQMIPLDYAAAPKVFKGPLTYALDPEFWKLDLQIPPQYRLDREPGELIVYHGVAKYNIRTESGVNVKGTHAIVDAIERLRSEGVRVRLEFRHDVPSRDIRFIQLQADIVVDQLGLGRYGSQAREAMMLGRPVVANINSKPDELGRVPAWIADCPVVHATADTIYDTLKDLLADAPKRASLGAAGRDYVLRWNSAAACADRFEAVYDSLVSAKPVPGGWESLLPSGRP